MQSLKHILASLVLVGSVLISTKAQTASGVSPQAVARSYAMGLVANDFRVIWRYSDLYNDDVRSETRDLPSSLWKNRIETIRRRWVDRIENDRKTTTIFNTAPCWVFFRPEAKLVFLETRGQKSFIQISYSNENSAPLINRAGFPRHLRAATLLMTMMRDRADSNLVAPQTCGIVEAAPVGTFPTPPLRDDDALALAKAVIPITEQPIITLEAYPAWNVPVRSGGTGEPLQSNINRINEVTKLLNEYGVEVIGPYTTMGYYEVKELRPPGSWDKFRLPSQILAGGRTPLPAYALSESFEIRLENLEQSSEDKAVATLRLTYSGCTPVCDLLGKLEALGERWARLAFVTDWDPYVKYSEPGWNADRLKKVSFVHELDKGWKVKGVGASERVPNK